MSTRYIVRFGNDYPGAGSASGTLIRAPWQITANGAGPYPRIVGGVTLGALLDAILVVAPATGWSSGDDEVLRGRWRVPNTDPRAYRIDLVDGPGSYRVGGGAAAASFVRSRWRMNDGVGGPPRVDVSFSGATVFGGDEPGNVDQWVALTGTNSVANAGAIDADAFDPPQAGVEVEFASGVMELINGGHASGSFSSDISFLWFEKVGGDPPPPAGPSAAVLHYLRESARFAGFTP